MSKVNNVIESFSASSHRWYDVESIKSGEIRDELINRYEYNMRTDYIYCLELKTKKIDYAPQFVDEKFVNMLPEFEEIYYIGLTGSKLLDRFEGHIHDHLDGSRVTDMLPPVRCRCVDKIDHGTSRVDKRDYAYWWFYNHPSQDLEKEKLEEHVSRFDPSSNEKGMRFLLPDIRRNKTEMRETDIAKSLNKRTSDNICICSNQDYTGGDETYY